MQKLNYTFNNNELLNSALTHRSVKNENNERLEFLGDALLNFIIAEQLYKKWRLAKEGELSHLRAMLVKGETLAEIAQEFEIGDFLRLGQGELKSHGFTRKSILADAFEAIIGAIYLDSNFEICKARVLEWFESRIKTKDLSIPKDPKTRLQEYLQAKHLPLPKYQILDIAGRAHAQLFNIACSVSGLSFTTNGIASTRRKAEQLAAEKYITLLTITPSR
jgi:ribonuclease III